MKPLGQLQVQSHADWRPAERKKKKAAIVDTSDSPRAPKEAPRRSGPIRSRRTQSWASDSCVGFRSAPVGGIPVWSLGFVPDSSLSATDHESENAPRLLIWDASLNHARQKNHAGPCWICVAGVAGLGAGI